MAARAKKESKPSVRALRNSMERDQDWGAIVSLSVLLVGQDGPKATDDLSQTIRDCV